jgi:hypothetical protein
MYEQAELSKDSFDIYLYIANCVGACIYDYMQTEERDAIDLWNSEWKEKFYQLLEK